MNWIPANRRFALVIAPAALLASAVLGASFARVAPAALQAPSPYSQAVLTPYVPNQPFMVTIQNPLYDANSLVQYVQVFSPANKSLGFWAPLPNNTTTTGQWFNTVNGANMITVLFDTTTLLTTAPTAGLPPAPIKTLPATDSPTIGPVITSGAILCIKTNVTGDSCPTNPIKINVTNVTPCPPCP